MAQTTKTAKSTKSADRARPDSAVGTNNWNVSNLFWGGMLMLVGLLFLLSNLGVISIAWGEMWRLWPIVVIVAGLSILKLRGSWAVLVYGLAAVVIVGLVWLTMTGSLRTSQSDVVSAEFAIDRSGSKVERVTAHVKTGASDLNIGSHGGEQVARGTVESRLSDLKYDSKLDGNTQVVHISQQRNLELLSGGSFNRFDVDFGRQLPTRLFIDSGASSIDADLSAIQLESVAVDSGASSVNLRLGDKLAQTDVDIDTGVSSVTIYVPKDSGVELNIDDGLSSKDIPDDYQEVDEGVYRSANHSQAGKKIIIDVDIGVSSFELLTY